MHERTAQRYLKAAKFAAKYDTVSYLSAEGEETLAVERLSPSAIYAISADDGSTYTKEAIAAILKARKTGAVDEDRAEEIAKSLLPPEEAPSDTSEPEAMEPSEEPEEPELEESEGPDEVDDEEKEAEEILDGPPPKVPPAAPPAPPPGEVAVLTKFEQGVALLKEVSTKPAAKFKATYLSAVDLEQVADFLKAVADTKMAKAA
jgi:hypothetical protein